MTPYRRPLVVVIVPIIWFWFSLYVWGFETAVLNIILYFIGYYIGKNW